MLNNPKSFKYKPKNFIAAICMIGLILVFLGETDTLEMF